MRLLRSVTAIRKDPVPAVMDDANYYVGFLTPSTRSPPPSTRRKLATPHTPPRPGSITLSSMSSVAKREVVVPPAPFLATDPLTLPMPTGGASGPTTLPSSSPVPQDMVLPSPSWRGGGQPLAAEDDLLHPVEEYTAGPRLSVSSSLEAAGPWKKGWEGKEL